MVERDKNRFCIVMWSMGNESAYGCNFEKALEWTKNFDPDRITQYESARYRLSLIHIYGAKHIPNMKNIITNAIFLFNLCKVFTEPPLQEINFQ